MIVNVISKTDTSLILAPEFTEGLITVLVGFRSYIDQSEVNLDSGRLVAKYDVCT